MIGSDRPPHGAASSRRVLGTAALGAVLALGVGACTAEAPADEAAAVPPATFLPDDRVAVTDAPRPEAPEAVLSFAMWEEATASVEAAGYVTPVIEDGGTCTLRLTRDGDEVAVTVPGMADATTTVCGGFSVPEERLAAGTWSLRLAYSSATADVVSEAVDVEVPA
ncbi:hypothetical protein E9549_22480 [Blastococcus sp. MG754426]|uniref:hypothetical protein n=1 Tax=unclassified Blastococcus TaxID=2619396 RepID=UPI001EF01322|nr:MULTISPECIES: hypothetical protein [unclassified Blastococcus]MCF6510133.1 hypothetical protein [Blastococcus sp. MG754426]MCF6514495.1 hypothetical protein [Blastococcus sp. MG754427]MCF6737710.1 hypothetical protein [Blastococcus sp. KM273129]